MFSKMFKTDYLFTSMHNFVNTVCLFVSVIICALSIFSAHSVDSVALEGDFFMPFYSSQTVCARDCLSDFEKEVFDTIVYAAPGETEFVFEEVCGEPIRYDNFPDEPEYRLLLAILKDCPHMFWFDEIKLELETLTGATLPIERKTFKITVTLLMSGTDINPIDDDYAALRAVVNSLDFEAATRYELLKSFHDYLCESITYDATLESDDCVSNEVNDRVHGVLGALCDGAAACQGYAKAFKFLCDLYEIPCVTICSENHMWNGVLMDDGCWYYVDVFGDDIGDEASYRYFLVGNETGDELGNNEAFSKTHKESPDSVTPEIQLSSEAFDGPPTSDFLLKENKAGKLFLISYFNRNTPIYINGIATKSASATGDKITVNGGEAEYTCVLLGDLNGDGECNVVDFSEAVNRALGDDSSVNPDALPDLAADIDRDGVIDVLDIASIERAVSRSNTNLWS